MADPQPYDRAEDSYLAYVMRTAGLAPAPNETAAAARGESQGDEADARRD